MESTEFDATLGGAESLPYSANSLKFAASRSVEIAAMTESILRPSKTQLVFQSLPVHMRRRVMSHNSKRLPRKLREAHITQMQKSGNGLGTKQKRPSRKYRRRPANLLNEYNRRQKRNIWLETHIWHAKRFHMIERWGHRLAYAPCDKAFRACYRATSAHCLLQDISYYTPIQISGSSEDIREMFKAITNPSCGLGIVAKCFINGYREGSIHIYEPYSFPNGYIGKVTFLWLPSICDNKTLCLFTHPSQTTQLSTVLSKLIPDSKPETESYETARKKRKLTNNKITYSVLNGIFNRFRLTGPNSHAILINSLKALDSLEKIKTNEWVRLYEDEKLYLKDKSEYWSSLNAVGSPAQLPPKVVIGLIVKDPRLMRPTYRTKAKRETYELMKEEILTKIPDYASKSPLWNNQTQVSVKKNALTNGQFIQHVTKLKLLPGEVHKDDPALQSVPVILIQRPGSQDPNFKKLGYGSGWDIIVPAGYGLPFWLTFIMFGARSGGLRESESLAFEMGECYMPPDSKAGQLEEIRIETELREKYFRLPASKRVNYNKLAINSPFICPWKILLQDWSSKCVEDFFILRDRTLTEKIQDSVSKKTSPPKVENADSCLVAVYIKLISRGNIHKNSLICLPEPQDIINIQNLFEIQREDPNEVLRKQKRIAHVKHLKRIRRLKIKQRNKSTQVKLIKKTRKNPRSEPSEYVKSMRELWLSSKVETVKNTCSREIMGYIPQGTFSFSEARSCGVGYVAYSALNTLLNKGLNKVLIRNTTTRKYRLATINVISNM